ncbi:MAG: hypothetical protein A2Y38_26110 [Spirochaetes bacterium GWB1_59_5]|nr:MAG: hypothetical protein A2Y38_26110 [Spirochaetes bacterium GWB1_59_5]
MDREDWQESAKCSGADTDTYHWEHLGLNPHQQAQALCAGCPVKRECATYALQHRITDYVFAGVAVPPADKPQTKALQALAAIANPAPKATKPVAPPWDGRRCPEGHALTEDNTYWSTVKSGHRVGTCKTCKRIKSRQRRAQQRAANQAANDARLRKAAS